MKNDRKYIQGFPLQKEDEIDINRIQSAWLALPLPTANDPAWLCHVRHQLSRCLQPEVVNVVVEENARYSMALHHIATGLTKLPPHEIAKRALYP